MHSFFRHLLTLFACLIFPMSVYAACTGPDGDHGDMLYNRDHTIMQFCNGTNWIGMGSSGVGASNGGNIQSGVTAIETEGSACTKTGELAKTSGGKLLVCQDDELSGEECPDFQTGSLSFNATGVLHVCTE